MDGKAEAWVQGELVSQGLAQAYSLPGHRACARDLQQNEDAARLARRGLWSKEHFRIFDAGKVELLLKRRGSYQLVEGQVVSVGKTRNWTFLNFSPEWRSDFTVAIASGDRKLFSGRGTAPEMLEGKKVRVRGWVERWNGPAIKATHPEQIEVLR